MNTIQIGSFVKSKRGRDKDNIYIVKKVFDKKVELVDGNGKIISKPKIKNIKHIEICGEIAEKIAIKFNSKENVYDAEIYSAIRKFKNK